MEACVLVEREQDKIIKKLRTLSGTSAKRLQGIIDQVSQLRAKFEEGEGSSPHQVLTGEQVQWLKQLHKTNKETCQSISSEHKDIHASISKFGRAIEKNFQTDISNMCVGGVYSEDESTHQHLNTVICEHLFRQGRLEIGEQIMKDGKLSIESNYVEQFSELNQVLDALRRKDVEPALEWALCHRDALRFHCSSLEFQLHQLKFLSLLSSGEIKESLVYAKVFGQFSPRHNKEIKRLMGCFLFAHQGLESSPYSDLLDPWHWTEAADLFAKDACKLLGLSLESPLEVSLSAGCIALPQLLRLQTVMQQRQVSDIWSRDELPCEVNLGWERRYHSVFTCPILRQQSSDNNPPVRLLCGHAISRDAMRKLINHSKRLKCPYCPVEMSEGDVQEIKF